MITKTRILSQKGKTMRKKYENILIRAISARAQFKEASRTLMKELERDGLQPECSIFDVLIFNDLGLIPNTTDISAIRDSVDAIMDAIFGRNGCPDIIQSDRYGFDISAISTKQILRMLQKYEPDVYARIKTEATLDDILETDDTVPEIERICQGCTPSELRVIIRRQLPCGSISDAICKIINSEEISNSSIEDDKTLLKADCSLVLFNAQNGNDTFTKKDFADLIEKYLNVRPVCEYYDLDNAN